jgi:hypothetical protein
MRRRQVLGRGGQDADRPALQVLDQQQRRGRDRHRRQSLEVLLIEREEAAARRQPDRTLCRQRPGIRLQRRQHPRPVGVRRDRVVGADAAQRAEDHREVERQGIADVALDPREPRIEHQDAERLHRTAPLQWRIMR